MQLNNINFATGYIIGGLNLVLCLSELYDCFELITLVDTICARLEKDLQEINPEFDGECGMSGG